MKNQQLLTYAILTVNDSHNKDYYDNFVPFVKETIRRTGFETISANDVKNKLNDLFHLELPVNVVNTILKKRLKPQGYIKVENRIFKPNYERLDETDFNNKRLKMLEIQEKLINEIVLFANNHYGLQVDSKWAESALGKFIDSHQINILEGKIDNQSFGREKDFIIISSFIKKMQDDHSILFNYLIDIIKGNILATAMYFTEPNMMDMHFKGTEVYFDTSFIIYALGLAGEARREPCSELLLMLRDSKAILRCFRHNVDEIIGILEWCKNNLTSSKADPHGTIGNFIEKGYGPSEIERIIYALDNEIKEKLNIKIVEDVPYDQYEFIIAEEELKDFLKSKVKYPRDNALDKDVKSISAIMRLRRGRASIHIEQSRALFVTTNYTMSNSVHELFYNKELPRLIPPVLHDSVITNLVWLKNPSKAPDLPRKRLIAECYAAAAPKEHLWERYIETLKIYENTGDINSEDLVRLRYTQGARELLVEKTLGDEDAVTIGTVQEILKEIKQEEERIINEARQEKDLEIEALRNEINTYENEIAVSHDQRELKVIGIAKKRAKYSTVVIMTIPLLLIGYLLSITPIIQNLELPTWFKNSVLYFSSLVLPILGLCGFTIISPIRKFQNKLFLFYKYNIEEKYY